MPVYPCSCIKRSYSSCICQVQKEPYKGAAHRGTREVQRSTTGAWASKRTKSSSSDTVKRIIVLRLHLMWIMSMVWESMSDVSERIQSMTGSSSDSHTTQYVVQPVEQCFVQSFLRHRVTSQRSRFSNLLENLLRRADFPFVGCGHRCSTQ